MTGSGNGKNDGTAKKSKRARKITFVFIKSGEVKLKQCSTNACSVEEAWREVSVKIPVAVGGGDVIKLVGAVPGHVDFMKEHIRKPTYKEMEAMLAGKGTAVPA